MIVSSGSYKVSCSVVNVTEPVVSPAGITIRVPEFVKSTLAAAEPEIARSMATDRLWASDSVAVTLAVPIASEIAALFTVNVTFGSERGDPR